MISRIFLLFVLCLSSIAFAQQAPGKLIKSILVTNANIHQGNGELIKNGMLLAVEGKIVEVQAMSQVVNLPKADLVIDAKNQHIYPGFIAANSTLGLLEIAAVKASRDVAEVGNYNANARSIVTYNTESKIIETVRPNGVLLAQITPQGGIFSGSSSVVHLDAWNWEDAAIIKDNGIHLHWPRLWIRPNQQKYKEKTKEYVQKVQNLHHYLTQAKHYNTKTQKNKNLRLLALQGIFSGKKTLFVHANRAEAMLRAIQMKQELNIPKMVFIGAYDAHLIMSQIKENQIAVLAGRVHDLPMRRDDDINHNFILPNILHKNGILVGLENSGDMQEMNTRNYPFYLGSLVGYGMDKETAVQLATQNTAKILGIDSNYGSLTPNKSATFFISKGDALDVRTNDLSYAFINGRMLNLNTFQKDLYLKFRQKYVDQGILNNDRKP